MKIVTIAFASAIALSAIAPAFAYENELELERGAPASSMYQSEHQAAGKRVGQHRAFDARASMPITQPAYVPATTPAGAGMDFGIGSQS